MPTQNASHWTDNSISVLTLAMTFFFVAVVDSVSIHPCHAQTKPTLPTLSRQQNIDGVKLNGRELHSRQHKRTEPHFATPRNLVTMISNPSSGSYRLIGSPSDIAIVHAAIVHIENQQSKLDRRCVRRIALDFQQAAFVASVLKRSLESEANGLRGLQIETAHHPESIILLGTEASVLRANQIIESIDSHPNFRSSKPNAPSAPTNKSR
jgi:hypothetical protein